MYRAFIKPILFLFQPETSHIIVSSILKFVCAIPGVPSIIKSIYVVKDKRLERKVFGLTFPNPIGLAAGFDKNADLFNEMSYFGFGFIEIGTVTPLAQPGNPKPRMFRLTRDQALINRMGFNNDGVETLVERLKNRNKNIILGVNIGKNRDTLNEQAVDDYKKCFEALFDYADYFTVNVSSPNTPGLRELQGKEPLTNLLNVLQNLNNTKKNSKPILLKISIDMSDQELDDIIDVVAKTKIAGIVTTNTSLSRENLKTDIKTLQNIGAGGLSGKPIRERSRDVVKYLSEKSNKAFPIIAVGGIFTPEDAIEKLKAGASLVQVYTGFTYEGPAMVKHINKELLKQGSF